MGLSKRVLMVMVSGLFLWGTLSLVGTSPSQAEVADREELGAQGVADREQRREQFHQRRRSIAVDRLAALPPCGSGTQGERWVVSKDGNSVCDNNTGQWWEHSPSMDRFQWLQAIDHCATLTLSGKTWRLPTVEEIQWDSLIDYGVPNQAKALNTPNGPFANVQQSPYWSATEVAGSLTFRWGVGLFDASVDRFDKDLKAPAWCVSGGQDKQ